MQQFGIRITSGVLFGILAAFLIGALPRATPPKAMMLSSAFTLRFSPRSAGVDHHSLTPSDAHAAGRFH
jgi:hypothetical protein